MVLDYAHPQHAPRERAAVVRIETHRAMTEETHPEKRGRAGQAPPVLVRMLERFSRILLGDLAVLIDNALQRIDDALQDRADKAESDQLYASYFTALRQLRLERSNLKRGYLRNLSDAFLLFQDAAQRVNLAAHPHVDSQRLELVKDKDLEESLVLSNMISKAENRYFHALHDLTRHFTNLTGRPALRQQEIPVSPTAICNALSTAVKSVENFELSTALIIYKVFDKQVMDNLTPVYAQCVELATSQGLEPSARHKSINNPSVVRPRRSPAGRGPVEAGSAEIAGEASSASRPDLLPQFNPETLSAAGVAPATGTDSAPSDASKAPPVSFQQLCLLLHDRRRDVEPPNDTPLLETQELMTVLSRLQQQFAADEAIPPSVLRQTVADELVLGEAPTPSEASSDALADSRRRLERSDEDAMDLVFLLFEQLLGAPDIPDSVKVLISRLQLPYVKLAIMEPAFFDQPQHPARSLLNHIGEASLGWNDDGERGGDGLYARIANIVERVITEFHSEPSLFQALDNGLAAYLDEQQRQAQAAERRMLRGIGEERQQHAARRHVMQIIDQRLPPRAVIPVAVASIIYDGWVEVMLQAHSRDGERGPGWQHALGVLDQLIWSIRPKQDPAERRELLRQIPQLLRDLRTGLSEVLPDQQLLEPWLKELQGVYIAALRGPAPETVSETLPATAPPETSEQDASRLGGAPTSAMDPGALPVGTWIDIMRTDDIRLRVKLAWRSDDGHDLLFVDRLGRKAFELSRRNLYTLFEQDLAAVISDGSIGIVDRAMHAVRESLSVH